ncbi:SLBB domain-containing protein, partial [Candidatus Bathyarchaeota archaeon]|nr:SLBB domain-containing protein [Candidatus Bathyarchaeota archaeon]
LAEKVEIKETGCTGFCEQGPTVTVYPDEILYCKVKPEDVPEIVSRTLRRKKVVARLLYRDPATGRRTRRLEDIPSYKRQLRLLLKNNARIDPRNIEDYIGQGGYQALPKALLDMKPETVIEEIKNANLRGLGGGGFPTWLKWVTTREAQGEPKYIIANCAEGDPGAFVDRALIEDNPHSVLEGLIIGAYAIGADAGYVYVREEYSRAVESITAALDQAQRYGFLGENIIGSSFNFSVKIHRSAGAYVSGESSALMTAIEGKLGEPRPKYIHTAVKGVWGKPTCLNNVKTLAAVPIIISNGAESFRILGTKGSSGTAIFSLSGRINNTGLVEVPMGTTLRDLVYKVGGGIKNGKSFKAMQVGGPSGGFISEEHLDLPVDFDELTKIGSMMGSITVIDEDTCMVDAAKYFVDFLLEESCGKCIPCREGLRVLSGTLDDICRGRGRDADTNIIMDVAEAMKEASLCALGRYATSPVLTSMKYFRDEWQRHLVEKRCPIKAENSTREIAGSATSTPSKG